MRSWVLGLWSLVLDSLAHSSNNQSFQRPKTKVKSPKTQDLTKHQVQSTKYKVLLNYLPATLYLMHGLDRFVVNSSSRLLSNQSHFAEHPDSVAHHADFASFIVVPAHRYLLQLQPGTIGQIEQLNIKTKPVDCGGFNQRPTDTHAKGLEAALRVPKRKTRCEAHRQIEYAPALFASPGLMHANQISFECPGTESHITLTEQDRLHQLGCFGYWCRKIRVGKEGYFTTSSQEA